MNLNFRLKDVRAKVLEILGTPESALAVAKQMIGDRDQRMANATPDAVQLVSLEKIVKVLETIADSLRQLVEQKKRSK